MSQKTQPDSMPAAWLGQRGIYRSRFEAVCNGEQLVDPLTLGELIQRAWPSPSTELAERGKEVPQAWLDVQAERRRQITAEGWTPEHDDLYCAAELPRAAAAYILSGANDEAPAIWPFVAKWWKPRDARANYVRAGALILAEIERLDRVAASQGGPSDA
ncbi:hypothetical protein ACIRT2_22595 [Pseudomonas aeruginosa]|uniref:hypothetical protein n=1 Tax=Pseudomonas aeruginosa TaxID=287 RepID=UPI0016803EA7|nr:hypothetical protein [Pseudomonas aeruginosa]